MNENLDQMSRALAAGASRRATLGGLLAGVAGALPWTAAAKKKKNRRTKRFRKHQAACNQWCGFRFGSGSKAARTCGEKAKEGKGPCYSEVAQGPGFFCTRVLRCGEQTCCTASFGGPVENGECCDGGCIDLNGTAFCDTV